VGVTSWDRRLLSLIGDTAELLDIEEFRQGLLVALRRAVPSDWVALSDIGEDPASIAELIDPPPDPELHDRFIQLAYQNPLIERYNATRDARATRITDVVSQEEFRSREIYRSVYEPMGLEYQMAFTLPHTRDRILGVVLARRDANFSDAERELIEAARPFLVQAYRNATRYSAVLAGGTGVPPLERLVGLGLSVRQAEALRLVAAGASERDIAARLGISVRTVQKHLQLCYRTLGVDSRSRAAAIAWSTLDGDSASSPA
jgi:DNA-binding CsgD family transcriptional regulator